MPRGVYTFDAHPLMMAGGVVLSALPSRSELAFWSNNPSVRRSTHKTGTTYKRTGTFKTYSADVWKKDKDVLYLQVGL